MPITLISPPRAILSLPRTLAAEINPTQLGGYLVSQGYELLLTDARGFAVYDRPTGAPADASSAVIVPSEHAIEIPTNPAHRDYPQRVCEALRECCEPWPGLLHKINPGAFPVSRLLALMGLPGGEPGAEPSNGAGLDLDDVARLPEVLVNVEGQHAGEEGKPITPHDLDLDDDPDRALLMDTSWHAGRCNRVYLRHPDPVQTGDCEGAEP